MCVEQRGAVRSTAAVPTTSDNIKRRKGQVRPKVREALSLIVTTGASITSAAESVAMTREALSRALKRPAVIEAKASLARAFRESQTERAILTIADLAANAASEDTRHKAARTWLEMVGELGPNRRDDTPRAPQLVQIINHGGPIDLGGGARQHSGVIEAPPYVPPSRPVATDDGDD